MLWSLVLFACSQEPASQPPPASNKPSSEVAAALASLQDGEIPPPPPPQGSPPPDPAGAESEPPPERPTSEACEAARQKRKEGGEAVRRYQNEALPALEAEYVRAKDLMDQCMQNIDVCGDKPETFEDLRDGAEAAMGRYERGLDRVAEMEADLYPLNQEVDRACGGRP